MSNSAIIMQAGHYAGVRLSWNGGRDSIEAFLEYCKLRNFGSFTTSTGLARFCQVVGNFMGRFGTIELLTTPESIEREISGLDNGVYSVCGWTICGRTNAPCQEQDAYDLKDLMVAIDKAQPIAQQLGEEYIRADEVEPSEIKLGDQVFIQDTNDGSIGIFTVIGFGTDNLYINGTLVEHAPYVNRFDHDGDYTWNINNYIGVFTDTVRRVRKAK